MKYKKNTSKYYLTTNTIKGIFLLLLLILLSYSTNLLFSPGVELSIEKGKILETETSLIFSKNFPPNSKAVSAYKINVENHKNSEVLITIELPYDGNLEEVKAEDFRIDNNVIFIYTKLGPGEEKAFFVLGEISIGAPYVYEGKIEKLKENYGNDTINKTTQTGGNTNLSKKEEDNELNVEPYINKLEVEINNMDTYSLVVLSLSIVLLVISSIIIASFSKTKKPRKKPLEPGEIIFKEDFE